ncbi:hypothetical protein FZEAL_10601 [Fusarium zealandicum]|uniref:Uncharacterized protein n=1 Tax=Fusarium zealandicum TaxID=1053134 RepID=A0A8H4TZH8_9HYPO|nr:hypothetical protein FZEAL_10601 [Fusarium zealandicum]
MVRRNRTTSPYRRSRTLITGDDLHHAVSGIAEPGFENLDLDVNPHFTRPSLAEEPRLVQRARFDIEAPSAVHARRRNIIVVLLYEIQPRRQSLGAERCRFNVDRDTLFTHLPRTRHAVRRGALDLETFFLPQDMEAHPPNLIHRALLFVFRHLEEFSRTGALDMFGAAEQQIQDAPVRAHAVTQWAAMIHAICIVLDNDRGLACSEDLLRHVLEFFEHLIQDVHNLLGWEQTSILFEAFAGILRTRRRDLVDQIRRIWDRFDPEVQEQLLRDMRRALPAEGVDGTAHRMYRALGY